MSAILRFEDASSQGSAFPDAADAQAAREAHAALRILVDAGRTIELSGQGSRTVKLPMQASRLLITILDELSRGRALNVVSMHAELTTQEAADILNISRPSLIDILDRGELPFRRVRTHRRIRAEDILKYKSQASFQQEVALEELAAYDQELGI